MALDPAAAAREFAQLFPLVYLAFHRRDAKRAELPNASRAVLMHLSLTGPLTIGEMAQHLERAQSVVSEIVDHLERDGLLERLRDARDRRRVLVWLTPQGEEELARSREVLSGALLERAMTEMRDDDLAALLRGMRALVATPLPTPPTADSSPTSRSPP
jgi:DNA-binding MarR family transcriptional regulator